jgi:hypothetical protein
MMNADNKYPDAAPEPEYTPEQRRMLGSRDGQLVPKVATKAMPAQDKTIIRALYMQFAEELMAKDPNYAGWTVYKVAERIEQLKDEGFYQIAVKSDGLIYLNAYYKGKYQRALGPLPNYFNLAGKKTSEDYKD